MILLSVLPPAPRRVLAIGQRHGRLTILAKGGKGSWKVRCDCGTEKEVQSGVLGKATVSCGCWRRIASVKHQPGDRFGMLTLVEKLIPGTRWRMRCDCGKAIEIDSSAIRTYQRSCGCYQAHKNKAAHRRLIGRRFGRLVVTGHSGRLENRRETLWDCVCDCGQAKLSVPRGSLVSGGTTSCGCAVLLAARKRVLPQNVGLTAAEKVRRYATTEKGRDVRRVACQRYARKRWASLAGSPGVTDSQWRFIQWAYENRCAYCSMQKPLTQDHVVPRSKGGHHAPDNVVPACWDCNYKKRARPLDVALDLLKVANGQGFVDKWSAIGHAAKGL